MRYIISLALVLFYSVGFAQTDFIAVASGNWNGSGVWSTDGINPITCGVCVAGTDFPGATDDAWTNGFSITIDQAYSVRDLMVENVSGSLVFGGNFLTINGAMLGWTGGLGGSPSVTSVNVFQGVSRLLFTAQDLTNAGEGNLTNNAVLSYWNQNSPITIAQFNLSQPASINTGVSNNNLAFSNQFNLQAGTLTIGTNVSQIRVSNSLFLGTNTILNTSKPLVGSSGLNSKMNLIQLGSGSQVNVTGANSVLNANAVRLIGSSTLNFSSSGSNFTSGWWYQNLTPSLFDLNALSSVRFNAIGDQFVPAITYGRLLMAGTGSRTLSPSGSLVVIGNLGIGLNNIFNSSFNPNSIELKSGLINNGTWNATQRVIFNGSANQTISGSGALIFNSGITIDNTSGTVTTSNIDLDINGEFNIMSGSIFNPSARIIRLSSNLVNNGSLTLGTGTGGFIFDGVTTLSGSGTMRFNNLEITGTLTGASGTMQVAGNFIDNGNYNANNGTVMFNGSAAQSISGESVTNYENIQISNTSNTISVSNSKNLIGVLTLDNNTSFNAGGNLTLISNASGDATVAAIPSTASLTGNVIYQRFFDDAITGRFRNFGFPVGANVSDLSDAGLKTTFNPYSYDETLTGVVDNGWVIERSSLLSNKGYTIYMYGDGDVPATVNISGQLNSGDVNLPVTYTDTDAVPGDVNDGWNFVGNPYASSIDWGAPGWTKIAVNGTCAVWNGLTYDYLTGAPGDLISSGQAFWVQTNSTSPVLTASQNVKSNSSKGFLRVSPEQDWLKVIVFQGENKDVTHIKFREDATEEFDVIYDAHKFQNAIHNVSTLSESGLDLAVNALPLTSCNRIIKLKITNAVEGDYSLSFEGVEKLISGYDITLVDKFLLNELKVVRNMNYEFSVTPDDSSIGENRFELHLNGIEIDENIVPSYQKFDNCDLDYVTIEVTNVQDGLFYFLKDTDGNLVSNDVVAQEGVVLLNIQRELLQPNNSLNLNVSGRNECSGEFSFSNLIEFDLYSIPEIDAVSGATTCAGANQSVSISAQGAPEDGSYRWYTSLNSEPIIDEVNSKLVLNNIDRATIYYVSAVNSIGCEGEKVPVQITFEEISEPIVADGYSCKNYSVLLEATGATQGQKYAWYSNYDATTPIMVSNDSYFETEALNESQYFYVSILNELGCESGRTPVFAEVLDLYVVPPIIEGITICEPQSVTLKVTGAPSDDSSYRWYASVDTENHLSGEYSSEFLVEEVNESVSYYVSLIGEMGCESERVKVDVDLIELLSPNLIVEDGRISTDFDADSYQWYLNELVLEDENLNELEMEQEGAYSVFVSSGGCGIFSETYQHFITGINNELTSGSYKIYPNPVTSTLYIDSEYRILKNISLYDLTGNLILSNDHLVNDGEKHYFDTSVVRRGFYILSIVDIEGEREDIKVIIK